MKPTKTKMKATHRCPVIRLALTSLAVAAAPLSAQAQTALIDLSNASAVTNPAGDGKYWNSLGSGAADVAATALVDSTNTASGISLAIDVTMSSLEEQVVRVSAVVVSMAHRVPTLSMRRPLSRTASFATMTTTALQSLHSRV